MSTLDPERYRACAAAPGAPRAWVVVAGLLCLIPPLQAQDGRPDVPAIPRSERFTPSDTLRVSLRVEPERVQVDEVPTFTVSVTNVSKKPVLVRPGIVPGLRIYTTAGEFVPGRIMRVSNGIRIITTLEDAITLGPGETVTRDVEASYGGRGGATLYEQAGGLGLSSGEYMVRFGYVNYPDYTWEIYDVRGARASQMWEGRIESPPVRFIVDPPTGERLAALLAQIDAPGRAVTAVRIAGAARLTEAIEPLLRRYPRDAEPYGRFEIARAIAAIGDPDAAARLLDLSVADPYPGWRRFLGLDLTIPARLIALSPDCARLEWLIELGPRWNYGVARWAADPVLALDAQCPGLRATLRKILQTPSPLDSIDAFSVSDRRRSAAAALLGALRDTESVPLLAAVLRQPPARGNFGEAVERVRGSAAGALVLIGGPSTHAALIGALDNRANDHVLLELLQAVERAEPPGADAALARLLSSAPPAMLPHVARIAGLLGGAAVVPRLQALVSETDPRVAHAVVSALRLVDGGAAVRAQMVDVAAHGPAYLRGLALEYLAEHGDAAAVPLLIDAVTAGEAGHGGTEGLERLGTAADARRLRLALESASDGAASSVHIALHAMTFAPYELGFHDRAADFAEWFDRRRGRTRTQWAEDAIDRASAAPTVEWFPSTAAVRAIAYLAARPDPPLDMLRRAAERSPSWMVRVGASRGLAAFDRPLAVRLLARELQNRYFDACAAAAQELEALTQHPPIDCTSPAERAAAAAELSR